MDSCQRGQKVTKGQVLRELNSEVEKQAVLVAKERIVELERRLDLIMDQLGRKEVLAPTGAISKLENC